MIASEFSRWKFNHLVSKITATHLIIIILLVSFAVYFNALFNGFVYYDDAVLVLENRWITDIRFVPDILTSDVVGFKSSSGSNFYRPMMHLIFMLNYHIFGIEPWGFHLVNILFHAGVSVLVFIIARRLLSQIQSLESNPVLHAFAASLLFAAHPIHTEAVAWVASLPDLSYAFFCLLSFYFYIRSEKVTEWPYFLSLMSFAIATLCKEPALMFPFILMAYDFAFRDRVFPTSTFDTRLYYIRLLLKRYTPYFAVASIYLGLRVCALGSFSPQESRVFLSAYEYTLTIFYLFASYMEKLILPLNLNAFYILHPLYSLWGLKGILSLAVVIGFILMIYLTFKKNRPAFFGLMAMLLPLLPALYIPALGKTAFAERYLYFPSFGFVVLISIGLFTSRAAKRGFLYLFIISLGLTLLYSASTISRNKIWENDFTLWSDTVEKSPDGSLPHNNLGKAYSFRHLTDEARKHYKLAIELNPENVEAHFNLGLSYLGKGETNEARKEFETALKIDPTSKAKQFLNYISNSSNGR